MNTQAPSPRSMGSTALLVSLTYVPLFLSILSFFPQLFVTHPFQRFLLGLAPWWVAYLSARWYILLAEKSSPLYHPLGCLAQCFVWVFHWVVSLYHAFFVRKYTLWTYLITVFCAAIVFISEALFHNLVMINSIDSAHLGVYEEFRKMYGRSLVFIVKLWYLVDDDALQQQSWSRMQRPMQSRSMTM